VNALGKPDRRAVAWKDPHVDWPWWDVPYRVVAGTPEVPTGTIVIERERRPLVEVVK
jgi:hypothetical protein